MENDRPNAAGLQLPAMHAVCMVGRFPVVHFPLLYALQCGRAWRAAARTARVDGRWRVVTDAAGAAVTVVAWRLIVSTVSQTTRDYSMTAVASTDTSANTSPVYVHALGILRPPSPSSSTPSPLRWMFNVITLLGFGFTFAALHIRISSCRFVSVTHCPCTLNISFFSL